MPLAKLSMTQVSRKWLRLTDVVTQTHLHIEAKGWDSYGRGAHFNTDRHRQGQGSTDILS